MSVVTPNQIIEAVQFASKAGDPHAAFRITLGGDKPRKNSTGTVTYMTWEVNIATAAGREWRKVAIRVANLTTCSSAKPSPYNKVQTMFRVGSTYKVGETVQQLGEAMHLMNAAWQHHIAAVLRTTASNQKNKTVHPLVQTTVGDPPKTLEKAEHMFRVEIKFPQDKPKPTGDKPGGRQQQAPREAPKDDAVPAIVIRDASKRVGSDFAPARIPDGTPEGAPLTYITLQHFITNGSSVSGVIEASEVLLSTAGCSLPLSWTLLIVKHVKAGREVSVADGLGDFASEIAGGGDTYTGEAEAAAPAAAAAPAIKSSDLALPPPEDEDEEGEGEEEPEEEEEEDTPAPVAPPPAAKPRAKPAAKKQ